MKHDGCRRGFHWLSKAWYAEATLRGSETIDEIMLGFYASEGGTTGEMCIRWEDCAGKSTPRLIVFNDAWDALACFRDVIEALADLDSTDPPPEEIALLLLECGFADLTNVKAA